MSPLRCSASTRWASKMVIGLATGAPRATHLVGVAAMPGQGTSGDAEALQLFAKHPDIALLFTDLGLPGPLNGRQLAEQAVDRYPRLRVLLTTGYASDAIQRKGWVDPTMDLIAKPFTAAALAARIVAEPLTTMMCCPPDDGAACIILAREDLVRQRQPGRPLVRAFASALILET